MQILSTKLSVPPLRSGLVARARLIQKLNQEMGCGFVLVTAPAGYGKSTLLSFWLNQAEFVAVWLALDERDNDYSRFLAYLYAAFRSIDGALALPLMPEPETELDESLTLLINRLAQLQHVFCLVLDDYHLIKNQTIHQAVTFLVEHAPSSLCLVISTRADPPLPLAKLRARKKMLELRQSDLCFTTQEAAAFLNHTMGLMISSADVERITLRTEGWIAGLQMAALSMQSSEDISGFIQAFTGSHYSIFDFLMEEILERQTPEIRRFLLYTSILDQFTATLCDQVVQDSQEAGRSHPSSEALEKLEHANLFIIPLDHERRWYRYHHLFSDLLRLMLDKTYPGLSKELHRRACQWYEAQGMPAEALQHALASGDMQLVAQILSANVMVLVETNEIRPVLEKIDLVPVSDMIALPWLGIARAWALGVGQVQKSQRVLDEVEKSIEFAPETAENRRLKGHVAAARAFVTSALGENQAAAAYAKEAEELLPPDEIAVRAMNLSILGELLSAMGEDSAALTALEQGLSLARQADKTHMVMILASSLATAHLIAGRLTDLYRVCQEALAAADEYQKRFQHSLSPTCEIYALLARVLTEWGEAEKAIQCAQKGLVLSEGWGRISSEVFCLLYLGRALIYDNEVARAVQAMERASKIAQTVSASYLKSTACYNLESLLDCETPDEAEIDRQIRCIGGADEEFPHLLRTRLLLRNHQPDQALSVLEQRRLELNGRPSYDTVRIYALCALAYQAKGDTGQALIKLRQALEFGEPENRIATFVREGTAMEKLLILAGAKSSATPFVQKLLAAFETRRKYRPAPLPAAEQLVETLSERELEVLVLLAQGCPDKKIAASLVIATQTVHKHLKNIYRKLDVHSRTEAIVRARQLGLL